MDVKQLADRGLRVVARGDHSELCAVLGCGEFRTHVRAADSGFTIGYCKHHFEQACRLFGTSRKEKAA